MMVKILKLLSLLNGKIEEKFIRRDGHGTLGVSAESGIFTVVQESCTGTQTGRLDSVYWHLVLGLHHPQQ